MALAPSLVRLPPSAAAGETEFKLDKIRTKSEEHSFFEVIPVMNLSFACSDICAQGRCRKTVVSALTRAQLDALLAPGTWFSLETVEAFADLLAHQGGHRSDKVIVHCKYGYVETTTGGEGRHFDLGLLGGFRDLVGKLPEDVKMLIAPVWKENYLSVVCLCVQEKRAHVITESCLPSDYWDDHVLHLVQRSFGTDNLSDWDVETREFPSDGHSCGAWCCMVIWHLLDGSDPDVVPFEHQMAGACRTNVIRKLEALYRQFGHVPR